VLEHFEPRDARPSSFIPANQATSLLARLIAEPISRRVIRLFAPDSTFLSARPHERLDRETIGASPDLTDKAALKELRGLPFAELPGLKFQQPPAHRVRHQMRARDVRHQWTNWKDDLGAAGTKHRARHIIGSIE
jgi:hypothetical protein